MFLEYKVERLDGHERQTRNRAEHRAQNAQRLSEH